MLQIEFCRRITPISRFRLPGSYKRIRPYLLIAAIFLPGFSAQSTPDPVSPRESLTARLDSVELQKQMRKRLGQPLNELEAISGQIRDSIDMLKNNAGLPPKQDTLADVKIHAARSAAQSNHPWNSFIPKSTFDWIIVAVGAVALLSGIILFAGLLQAWRSRSGRHGPAKPLSHHVNQSLRRQDPAAKPPASPEGSLDESIATLRKRMTDGLQTTGHIEELSPPGKWEEQQSAPLPSGSISADVVSSSGAGMGPPEISRKFHISVDQVNLILRMAKK